MQRLDVVDKSVTFSRFAEVLKKHLDTKFSRRLKGEDLRFLELKKSPKVLIETDKRAYTTANVKLTINSVRAS